MNFLISCLKKIFQHDHEKLFFGSIFLFFLTFVFYFPAKILSGNTLEILVSDETFFTGLALVFLVSLILYLPYKFLYLFQTIRPILQFLSYSLFYWTASCIFYGIFRTDILKRFGKLQGISFENFSITTQEIWVSLSLYLLFLLIFLWIVRKIQIQHLLAFLFLTSLIFLVEGLYLNRTQTSPQSKARPYIISETQNNTIVFILDMFQGDVLPRVFRHYPEIKSELEGFTWYPYAQSVGEGTVSNIYRMVAGKKYTLQYLNSLSKKDDTLKVADLAAEVLSHSFLKKYHDDGAKVFLLADYTLPFDTEKMSFLSAYTGDGGLNHNFLLNLSLLRGVPLFLKPYIYRNPKGKWRVGDIYTGGTKFEDMMKSIIFQKNYPETLHVFHTNKTHVPYNTAKNCQQDIRLVHQISKSSEEERERASYSYGCTLKTIIHLMQRLKQQNIYDQTRIVIMADHGASHTGQANIQHVPNYQIQIDGRWNPLILIKDFKERGKLQISPSLMLTIDLPAWICDRRCPDIEAIDNRDGHLQKRFFQKDHAIWNIDWYNDRFFKGVPSPYEEEILTYDPSKR